MSKKQWREVALADSCCGCGSVLTDLENDEAWDGDEARCDCCGRPGHVSADEDGAHVNWHDEPTCQCWWCQTQDELTRLRAELAEAKAGEAASLLLGAMYELGHKGVCGQCNECECVRRAEALVPGIKPDRSAYHDAARKEAVRE